MTLTLAEARTTVSDHMDDDGTRWAITQGGPVDKALKASLSSCLADATAAGVDRFDEEVSSATTAAGALVLSTYDPLRVASVSMLAGTQYWPLRALQAEDRNVHDANARTLQVRLTRNFALPTTSTHPLVGVGATAAKSTEAFDNWVCAEAAILCAVKDAELRQELEAVSAKFKAAVLGAPRIPPSSRWPKQDRGFTAALGWLWQPGTQTLQLCQRSRAWW